MVPSCGVESFPADIVAWLAIDHARKKLSAEPTDSVGCIYDFKYDPRLRERNPH
jgi:hypothetical protein